MLPNTVVDGLSKRKILVAVDKSTTSAQQHHDVQDPDESHHTPR